MPWLDSYVPWVAALALVVALGARGTSSLVLVRSRRAGARMSGYAVARHLLDGSGLYQVDIERGEGEGMCRFDPRRGALRLSGDVYFGRHLTALGVAAHEVGHVLLAERHRWWSHVRHAVTVAANLGGALSILLAVVGLAGRVSSCLTAGLLLFSAVVTWQVLGLPLEWRASRRATRVLTRLGIVETQHMRRVQLVLLAATLASLGSPLQSVATLFQWSIERRTASGPRRP